jgi:hypothetical protein
MINLTGCLQNFISKITYKLRKNNPFYNMSELKILLLLRADTAQLIKKRNKYIKERIILIDPSQVLLGCDTV